MTARKKRLILTAVLLCAALVCSFFIVANCSHHNCTHDDDCAVCRMIAGFVRILSCVRAAAAETALFTAVFAVAAAVLRLFRKCDAVTPVTLRTELRE
jgi:hypothetical protein